MRQHKGHGGDGDSASSSRSVQRKAAGGAPGKRSLVDQTHGNGDAMPVQARASSGAEPRGDAEPAPSVQSRAAQGVAGPGGPLPHGETIQRLFGASHDVSGVKAHVGDDAAAACDAIGASAFATGDHVAFRGPADLHTAAHEAAHVVQQRAGVHLKGGVGAEGDAYEQHADRVADMVASGQSAEAELDRVPGGGGGGGASAAVQRIGKPPMGDTEQMHADIYGDSSLAHAPTGGDAAATYKDTVNYATSATFQWSKYKGTQPTIAILGEWLDYFWFHEPRPLDYDHEDRCQFNGSTAYFTANVASIFVADASGAAALTYNWSAVKGQIELKLAPMRAARLEQEKAINTGKAPGPANDPKPPPIPAKDADTSTQTSIQWMFVPKTVHKEMKPKGETSADQPVEQVTGQWTLQFHKDGQAGGELFAGGQVTLTADRSTQQVHVQNVAAATGGQWVIPFLDDFIELQGVAQIVLGATLQPGVQVNGSMTASRIIAGGQVVGGANVVFNVPGTNKKFQIVLQAQGGASVGGGTPTADATGGIGVTFVY
jgi:hypothetical protein